MLWSPSEVLAYLKEDENAGIEERKEEAQKSPFDDWPAEIEDFVLIAENSEIHGPNPLFTIPDLESKVDLYALSTRILSADYQGLSSSKNLPIRNAQLLMPDISDVIHAAVNYFYIFDVQARGYVRPTCLAYFTSNKLKLTSFAHLILERLQEASSILQHSNVRCCVDDFRKLKVEINSLPNETEEIKAGSVTEERLRDIDIVLNIIENYERNDVLDHALSTLELKMSQRATSPLIEKLYYGDHDNPFKAQSQTLNPSVEKSLEDLNVTCRKGLVLSLYHLYITQKYFRQKYENLSLCENLCLSDNSLYFGACVISSSCIFETSSHHHGDCMLQSYSFPETFSMADEEYFCCFDESFEELLLRYAFSINSNYGSSLNQSGVRGKPHYLQGSSSPSNDQESLSTPKIVKHSCCRHIVTLTRIWDVLEQMQKTEASFLELLKLFDDCQKILYAILIRTPILIFSTPEDLETARHFVMALSAFVPRRKGEELFADIDRKTPLKKSDLQQLVLANICLYGENRVGDFLPPNYVPSLCILNLKDFSLTAPLYTGFLLSKVDNCIRSLPLTGPVFPILTSLMAEIQRTVRWHLMATSSNANKDVIADHLEIKGYSRMDMRIIEKLSCLCKP